MKIVQHEQKGTLISEAIGDGVFIAKTQDALDLMVMPKVSRRIIVHKENVAPEFFDLSTGLAGETLQKFVNYGVRIAIVGDFTEVRSPSLRAFITESNRGYQVGFFGSLDAAKNFLSQE